MKRSLVVWGLGLLVIGPLWSGVGHASGEGDVVRVARVPEFDGPWVRVAASPELPEISSKRGQVVDHCFFRAKNGRWQLWMQIRDTAVGRLFYRCEGGEELEAADWTPRGICWRADRQCGESCKTGSQEFIHAPYVLQHEGRWLLYYGGGKNRDGKVQISAAASDDGIQFRRLTDDKGQTELFTGPGYARDPMVLRTDQGYVMYYAGDLKKQGVIAVRTASEPIGAPWSDARIASEGGVCGTGATAQQCPFVVHLDGYYYLFKIGPSSGFKTAVYRSDDPLFFGRGDERLVTVLKAAVAEIIREGDRYYLSSLLPGYEGVAIRRLRWRASQ